MTQTPVTPPRKPTRKPPSPPAPTSAPAPKPPTRRPPQKWQSPSLGLARPEAAQQAPEVSLGTWAGTESSTEYTPDETGNLSGKTSTSKATAGAGAKRSHETESSTFDGTTKTTSEHQSELLAGAEAAIQRVNTYGPQAVELAVEGCARAGVFGSVAQQNAIKRGPLGASWAGSISGGAGIQSDMAAKVRADVQNMIPALEAAFSIGVRLGLWGEASLEARANAGPLIAEFASKVEFLVGGEATFEATAFASLRQGLGAEMNASAFGGARAKGEASVTIGAKPVALELGVEGEAMAGAEAEARAKVQVSLTGVKMSLKASAFAGARAKGTATASLKIMGKRIVSASGEISVSAGAGAEVEGTFELSAGRIHLRAGGEATLGVGMGALGDLDIDLEALGLVIAAELRELSREGPKLDMKSPGYERKPIVGDPVLAAKKKQTGYDAVYEGFLAYANKKVMNGENGVKREKVQAIITDAAPLLRADFSFVEVDRGIEEAALRAFRGQVDEIQVQAGVIRQFQPAKDVQANRTRVREDEGMRAVRDALRADLAAYAVKKAQKGKEGVKKEKVEAIIGKHATKVSATFGAEADDLITFVAGQALEDYVDEVAWAGDKLAKWTEKAGGGAAVKAAFAKGKTDLAQQTALTKLAQSLTAYKSQVVGDGKLQVDTAKVATLVKKALGSLQSGPELDQAVTQTVTQALAGLVTTVSCASGVITLTPDRAGLATARADKVTQDRQNAEDAAVTRFKQNLVSYREKKTSKGDSGLNQARVAQLLATALKGFPIPTDATELAALDATLAAAAEEALGDAFGSITVKDGQVTGFTEAAGVVAAEKQRRKKDGVKVLDETADEDNTRRRLVAEGLRPGLKSYAAKVHGLQTKKPGDPGAKVSKQELQKIIDKGLKRVAADVRNAAGDGAAKTCIMDAFPEIDEATLVVTDLVVGDGLVAGQGMGALAAARRAAWPAMQKAQQGMVAELRGMGAVSSVAVVQAVVDNHVRAIRGIPEDELEAVVFGGVTEGLGSKLRELDVEGGTITKLELVQTRGRSDAVVGR